MVILENIDIDIDKAILQNIDIDEISNRFKFGISNRASRLWPSVNDDGDADHHGLNLSCSGVLPRVGGLYSAVGGPGGLGGLGGPGCPV